MQQSWEKRFVVVSEKVRKWVSFWMVAAILILSIVKTTDRFTGTQARAAIEARDADRRAIWRELCDVKPDCDRTPEPVAPAK